MFYQTKLIQALRLVNTKFTRLFAFLFLAASVTRLLCEQQVSPTCQHKKRQLFAGYYQACRNVQPCDNTKYLMTCPVGNSEFCFNNTLKVSQGKAKGNTEGKQNSPFPMGPVINIIVLLYLPAQNQAHKCCFPRELHVGSCVHHGELMSFNPQHLTRSSPIGKCILVGKYYKHIYTTQTSTYLFHAVSAKQDRFQKNKMSVE